MMTDTIDVQLGQALSRAGGIGLSSVLLKALERTVGAGHPSTVAPAETAPAAPVALPARPLSPSLEPGPGGLQGGAGELQVPDGQVTSGYGWRRDPFTGAPRFHAGIDVARAYGQDVQAAAAGRVMFTGDRGAYGTMIVVEHGQGRQTRYAHLSGISVKPGDAVEAGQVIGQSGDSGRTTGPHLHFEVTTSGQAVDPAAGQ
jgi:murein DD-endopeptidase MepM/ murein hydrolase activator NlpD